VNKVVAILGIIVLITLGGLFFCAGFFTGTTVFPALSSANKKEDTAANSEKGISLSDVEAIIDTQSATMSEKVMAILASAAETASSSISDAIDRKNSPTADESAKVSIDSLLREIAAGHAVNDDCSPQKTLERIHAPAPLNPDSLHGKRIVFIGYFKNKIALEIQKLLIGKGYRTHLEQSRTGDGESFIFCGPFKKEKNAKKLLKWLRKHDFSEARLVNISNESIEETLYDAINDDSGPPENSEKDIPEAHLPPLHSIQHQGAAALQYVAQ
jgi:cell division septation protein DedD